MLLDAESGNMVFMSKKNKINKTVLLSSWQNILLETITCTLRPEISFNIDNFLK